MTGVRARGAVRDDAIEVVWRRASRRAALPLLDQRWTALPADSPSVRLVDGGAQYPKGAQTGVRWNHVGAGFEYSLSFFDGFNHLPNIEPLTPVAPSATSTLVE